MKQYASKLYEWVLFAPAVLPLFYIQGMMYPLLAPKTLALRAFGFIVFALFAYLALIGKPFFWSRLKRWTAWIPAALLVVAYGASVAGVDFYHSFWSTFERGDGLLTLTVCIGYFYLLLISAPVPGVGAEKSWIPRLFKVVAWVGTLAAAYAVLQWIAVSTGVGLSLIAKPNGRVGGTMGNAAFLAAYLGMTFFATLAAAPEYKNRWRKALYAGAGLQIFAIVLAATRGTLLALALIGIVVLAHMAWKGSGRARTCARATLVLLVAFGGLFFAFRGALRQAPVEAVRRVASISLADPTVSSRLFLWSALSREALGRPFLGYGAENISVPFDRVYDPTRISEEWFDRSHNTYLDYVIQFGVGGFLLYVALVALLFASGWQMRRAGNRYSTFVLGIAAVYALQNFFVFDTAMTFWLLAAVLAVALVYRASPEQDAVTAVPRPHPLVGACAGIAVLSAVIPVAVQPLRANLLAFEAYQYQIVDVSRVARASRQALALGTYADLELGYNAYFMYTDEQMNRLSGADLSAAYENAAMLLAQSFSHYDSDVRTAVYLAHVLSSAPPGAAVDQELLSAAIERSLRFSPKRSQPWYILVNLAISEANTHPIGSPERLQGYAAAKDLLARYIALVPELAEPRFVLAQLAYANGDTTAASQAAAEGKERYAGSLEAARRAAGYYSAVENLPNLGFFLSEIVKRAPTDYASLYDLAKVKFLQGDRAGAEAIVRTLRSVDPSIIDTDPAFKEAIGE